MGRQPHLKNIKQEEIGSRWQSRNTCVHLLLQEDQNLPSLVILKRDRESPGNDFEAQQDLIIWLPLDWRKHSTPLLESTNKTLCTPGSRRKEPWSHRRLSQTYLWVFEGLLRRCGWTVACRGDGETGRKAPWCWKWLKVVLGDASWHKSSWRVPLALP